MMLSPADIDSWIVHELQAVVDSCVRIGAACVDGSETLGGLGVFEHWQGAGADAAHAVTEDLAVRYEDMATTTESIAKFLDEFPGDVARIKDRLSDLRDEAEAWNLSIDDETGRVSGGIPDFVPNVGREMLLNPLVPPMLKAGIAGAQSVIEVQAAKKAELQQDVNTLLADAYALDDEIATAILVALGRVPASAIHDRNVSARGILHRHDNQRRAFKEQFDYEPRTPADWVIAEALDPTTYDDKYQGASSTVVVAEITPQPGLGVVRTNLFIPSEEVQNVSVDPSRFLSGQGLPMNAGDNRGADPNATAEQSRVSVYVDYDNGVVIARQNPTVTTDNSDRPRAGTPKIEVNEKPDGTLSIGYNATDTFQPEIATKMGIDVEGDITLTPHGADGVSYQANVTPYPSVEAYRIKSSGEVDTLARLDATMSPLGPMLGLRQGPIVNLN